MDLIGIWNAYFEALYRFTFFFSEVFMYGPHFSWSGEEVCWQEGCVLFFQAGFKYNWRIYQSDLDLNSSPCAVLEGEVQQHTCLSSSMWGVSRHTENSLWRNTSIREMKWWGKNLRPELDNDLKAEVHDSNSANLEISKLSTPNGVQWPNSFIMQQICWAPTKCQVPCSVLATQGWRIR